MYELVAFTALGYHPWVGQLVPCGQGYHIGLTYTVYILAAWVGPILEVDAVLEGSACVSKQIFQGDVAL
jgi:hypothetical protein